MIGSWSRSLGHRCQVHRIFSCNLLGAKDAIYIVANSMTHIVKIFHKNDRTNVRNYDNVMIIFCSHWQLSIKQDSDLSHMTIIYYLVILVKTTTAIKCRHVTRGGGIKGFWRGLKWTSGTSHIYRQQIEF